MFWEIIESFLLGTGFGITLGFYVAEREWKKKPILLQSGVMESRSNMEGIPDSMVEIRQKERRKIPESAGDSSFWKVHRKQEHYQQNEDLVQKHLAEDQRKN